MNPPSLTWYAPGPGSLLHLWPAAQALRLPPPLSAPVVERGAVRHELISAVGNLWRGALRQTYEGNQSQKVAFSDVIKAKQCHVLLRSSCPCDLSI